MNFDLQSQEDLLRASLLRGPAAEEAFDRWRPKSDLDTLSPGATRLLPLLHDHLLRQGRKDAEMDRLRGLHRHAWVKNQLLLRRSAEALRRLREAGVEALVLKGAALAVRHYTHLALRPMVDVDLLVRPEAVPDALRVLGAIGWQARLRRPGAFLEVEHSLPLYGPGGLVLDLHAYLLPGALDAVADDPLWARAQAFEMAGQSALALEPTDQLLHVCLHGMQWQAEGSLQWAADAHLVVGTSVGRIDWQRLEADAVARGAARRLGQALGLLQRVLGTAVPAGLAEGLSARPCGWLEQIDHRLETGPPFWLAGRMLRRTMRFWRWRRSGKGRAGFLGYLQRSWDVDRPSALATEALTRGLRRLKLDTGW